MTRALMFFMLSLIPAAEYSCLAQASTERDGLGGEEFAVYSALLNERYINDRTTFLLIIDRTVAKPFLAKELERDDIMQMLSPVSPTTVDAFKKHNKEPKALGKHFDIKVRYDFLKEEELGESFKGDVIKGWEEFYHKFPGATGFIRLSAVAFNPERDEALVYVEHGCGATCGTGHYVLLIKGGEGWEVEKTVMLWIS